MSLNNTSKFLALILRHKPEVIGIKLDEHGWADVDELLRGINQTRKIDMETLEQMHEDGIKFFKSVNNVWLTKEVAVKYISKI